MTLFPHEGFLKGQGIKLEGYEEIKSGRNSKVWKLISTDGALILKDYFQTGYSERNRLETEWNFLAKLTLLGISQVAQPIACDKFKGLALFSFIEGSKVDVIEDNDIQQAADFICRINLPSVQGMYPNEFPLAVDACLKIEDHINLVKRRLYQLSNTYGEDKVSKEATKFVSKDLFPAFRRFETTILKTFRTNKAVVDPILSPSDFGFHNVIKRSANLYFLDFEYAGWDSPLKLICDFICQPQKPVTNYQAVNFVDSLCANFNWSFQLKGQVNILLLLHRLKWCCIMLNEFNNENLERRLHAGIDGDGLLEKQLAKSQKYFSEHCHLIEVT